MLKIYNSLTHEVEEFIPYSKDNIIRMYSCGMTVQDLPHIGHIRAAVTSDIVKRVLHYAGYKTYSVYNFTDIDDKLIAKMKDGPDYRITAQNNIDELLRYFKIMNIIPFDVYPRATTHIQEITEFISKLIEKGNAYKIDGDVYFKVDSFPEYGKLSRKKIEELIEGHRVELNESKGNPLDFVLWKGAKENEPYWHSPFGKGRPGWHIECSAMSMKYLGETFDIHTGGEDLIFPHHENEIAQSECATGKLFVKYWLHNGMVNLKGEKMSKSVGNVFKVKDILALYAPNVIRFYLFKTHYRKNIEFTVERLEEAKTAFDRILNVYSESEYGYDEKYMKEFEDSIYDDFNTPKALGIMFDIVSDINQGKGDSGILKTTLKKQLNILGFYVEPAEKKKNSEELINLLLEIRDEARVNKDFALSDKVRNRLKDIGITVNDSKDGVRWKTED